MIKPKAAGTRSTRNASLLLKDGEMSPSSADAKPSDGISAVQHCHAKNVRVVIHRALQVADLKGDVADMRFVRQPMLWTYAI